MAKKGRKQTKQDAAKADDPVVDGNTNDEKEIADQEAEENNDTKAAPKRGSKRASSSKNDTPAKKKKTEENGVGTSRPKRATASKAAKEVKSLLAPKKKAGKKSPRKRSPSPKKEPSQFEVESIIDSRKRKGRTEFKIRWKGYTASSDTWEPARNLNCPEILEAWKADQEKEKAE